MNPNTTRLRDNLGYRAVVGVLVPFTNTTVQPEYDDFRPAGVTNHVARMEQTITQRLTDDEAGMAFYRERLSRDSQHVKQAIDQVLPAEPHAIIVGHSIDSFRGGLSGANKMKAELEAHSNGVPVYLPAHALVSALKALGVGRRLSAITPYFSPGNDQVREFFQDAGFDVVRVLGLRRPRSIEIAATSMQLVIDGLKELAADKPDVIVQPGTNLALARFSVAASAWLGIPVVSCNTATYWHAMRGLGIRDRLDGFGPLFADH